MEEFKPMFGWYGKIPAAGDFVSRRLPRGTIDALDAWFQKGMTELRDRAPDTWQQNYAVAPVWNALLPSNFVTPSACLAVFAASCDRVGRRYPFCVIGALPAASSVRLASLAARCGELSRLVERSLHAPVGADEFDRRLQAAETRIRDDDPRSADPADISDVLGELAIDAGDLATVPLSAHSAFPWPDLAHAFEPEGATSYWWTGVQAGGGGGGFTHHGALDTALFLFLFGEATRAPQHAEPPG